MTTKPSHYKIVCISLYTSDIRQLDDRVAELKRRGWTKANKSHLIRLALAQMDVEAMERALATSGMVRHDVSPDDLAEALAVSPTHAT